MPPKKTTFQRSFGSKKRSRKQQLSAARKKIKTSSDSVAVDESSEINNSKCSESARQRKFRLFEDELNNNRPVTETFSSRPTDVSGKSSFIFIDTTLLENLIKTLGCSSCKAFGNLKIVPVKHFGLATELVVTCDSCGESIIKMFTSKRCNKNTNKKQKQTAFEINRRATLASIYGGYGFGGLKNFQMIMGTPIFNKSTFVEQSNAIGIAVEETLNGIIQRSADCVRNAYAELNIQPDDDGILDIAVSYDGTWMKRGHTSNFGVGIAIDLITGLVLDFKVYSRYCHACALKERKLKSDEFKCWFEMHKDSCDKNFFGTSGSMEAAAAVEIWRRSVEKHKFRYTTLLSDGDAKTHQALVEANIYGQNYEIKKEECVNHVGKRMFTALAKLVSENRSKGITLGGRGRGKLTKSIQEKLSNYYRSAIKNNTGDLKSMRNAVFATLFHCISTDDEPHHYQCPQGENSWCFYNKAIALGETPGNHTEMISTPLNKDVAEKILPIYKRLGDENLLSRCLKGKTQNANESLHSVIWRKCPKTSFLHLKRVMIGVGIAIIDFNYGYRGIENILQNMKVEPGSETRNSIEANDKKRMEISARCKTVEMQRVREIKRLAQQRTERKLEEIEGSPSYESGGFL